MTLDTTVTTRSTPGSTSGSTPGSTPGSTAGAAPGSAAAASARPLGPSAMDDYEFDLRGFVVIRGALSPDEVAALNDAYDRFPELANGEWYGNAQRRDYTKDTGFELHNVLDCGDPAFDVLIDHPSWIRHVAHWAGEEGTYVQGVMIEEHIATSRGSGGHHPVHSGGHDASIRTQYAYRNGRFRCGQVNVLVSLRDVGPGDGATMIVPGSHKSNFMHPLAGDYARGDRMDALPHAIEVHTQAGDAVVFVDACMHGACTRTNDGDRRIVILRYGPPWARTRFGYTVSDALLARVTPERRRIMQPMPSRLTGDPEIPVDLHSSYQFRDEFGAAATEPG
ncbi:MAG: phytanoyl-CoA dioxygenase family protein [Actinomycetes bacterium]